MQIFKDSVIFDSAAKTAVSVRDGVLEYYGHEIGHEPSDKVFTVYRSPATIAKAAALMDGLPITIGHVDVGVGEEGNEQGSVGASEVIDYFDDFSDARLAVKNVVTLSDAALQEYNGGSRQMSLGYKGNLLPHTKYDFEQVNIMPYHLAIVDAGRCGAGCSFLDKKPTTLEVNETMKLLPKAFLDEDGKPSLAAIVEITKAIPEAIKELSVDELQEVMPVLESIVKPEVEDVEVEDEDKDEEEMTDEEKEKEFADRAAKHVKQHTEVILKAQKFLDASYDFADKDATRIMRDTLAIEHGKQSFTDAELPIAFKLLKKSDTSLQNFGDAASDAPKTFLQQLAGAK